MYVMQKCTFMLTLWSLNIPRHLFKLMFIMRFNHLKELQYNQASQPLLFVSAYISIIVIYSTKVHSIHIWSHLEISGICRII